MTRFLPCYNSKLAANCKHNVGNRIKSAEMKNANQGRKTKLLLYLGSAILLVLLVCLQPVRAQEDVQLRLIAVDTAAFPLIRITLLTSDSRGAPADLADLAVREDGAPITELTLNPIPHGVDVTFVLDANNGFGEIDEDTGLTRREQSFESIRLFAEQYMNPDGLDTVSIIVPDEEGQNGRLLVQEASTIAEIERAMSAYDPQRLGPTPLNAMLVLALEEAQRRKENGRYQAVLLLSDGRRLDQQLSYPLLIAQASDANTPVYSAILGETADAHEIDNVTRLSEPTRGFYVHLDEPAAAAPIYQIWQDQSNPMQVEYRSRQRQSGRNQLTLNLGPALVATSFDLQLSSPEVALSLDKPDILRAGTTPDTPIEALQPTVQPVAIAVNWPDGLPRLVRMVTLSVNGQPIQFSAGQWEEDDQGRILVPWNISNLEEGTFELAAEVIDELGYRGSSEPITAHIASDRPEIPTPIPTIAAQEEAVARPTADWTSLAPFAAAAGLLFLLLLLLFIWRRKKGGQEAAAAEEAQETRRSEVAGANDMILVASLEPISNIDVEPYLIEGANVAIGSEAKSVQIFLNDGSVNRLHARIRRQGEEYWLFDEGSFEGTYLNYERLGLAPQKLSDGDAVQFGKVKFRFHLQQVVNLE